MRLTLTPAVLLVALTPAIPGLGAAAEEKTVNLAEVCKTTKCRPPGSFKLRTGKDELELEQPGLPYVYQSQVIILPGDEFDIEVKFSDKEKTAKISLPKDTPRPEHTIHIKFDQMDDRTGMMLSLRNGTAAKIKYDAHIVLPDGRGGKTSSCPVMAGLSSFEMWPEPIYQLILSNFRRLKESDGMVCE